MGNATLATLELVLYFAVGTVVMMRLEMRLTGMTWKEIRTGGSAEKAFLFRTSSLAMIVLLCWPMFWLLCRNRARGAAR